MNRPRKNLKFPIARKNFNLQTVTVRIIGTRPLVLPGRGGLVPCWKIAGKHAA